MQVGDTQSTEFSIQSVSNLCPSYPKNTAEHPCLLDPLTKLMPGTIVELFFLSCASLNCDHQTVSHHDCSRLM